VGVARIKRKQENVLVYRNGKRKGMIVRRQYMEWRRQQAPSLLERCDNPECQFHSGALEWNGRPFKLILDHINGNNTDNRSTNLRLLCPNCDSQNSITRGGANRGRIEKSDGGFAIVTNGRRDYILPAESGHYALSGQEIDLVNLVKSTAEVGK
jgi:hypothetical protein